MQIDRWRREIETHKDTSAKRKVACLGSLAVKRVLGKDESPGSNPGLGLEQIVQIPTYFGVIVLYTTVSTLINWGGVHDVRRNRAARVRRKPHLL